MIGVKSVRRVLDDLYWSQCLAGCCRFATLTSEMDGEVLEVQNVVGHGNGDCLSSRYNLDF